MHISYYLVPNKNITLLNIQDMPIIHGNDWVEIVVTDSHELYSKERFPELLSDNYARITEVIWCLNVFHYGVRARIYQNNKCLKERLIETRQQLKNFLYENESQRFEYCVYYEELSLLLYTTFSENIHLYIKRDSLEVYITALDVIARKAEYNEYELDDKSE